MADLSASYADDTAVSLDHIGIAGPDLNEMAAAFQALGFHLAPYAVHASGRTANRCVMFRDGGYLELMAKVPGKSSTTLDQFLAIGPGAHSLALEVNDEKAVLARLTRAGIVMADPEITARPIDQSRPDGPVARFVVAMPPDSPDGRVLLIRHLTRALLRRPETTSHPNAATALTEAVYSSDAPAETMARMSRLSGRPAEPDPAGGFRISLSRGTIRILPVEAVSAIFPGSRGTPPLAGITITAAESRVVHAGGLAIRFVAAD